MEDLLFFKVNLNFSGVFLRLHSLHGLGAQRSLPRLPLTLKVKAMTHLWPFACDSLLSKSEALPCSWAKIQSQPSPWAVLRMNKSARHPVQGLSQKPEVHLDFPWQPCPRLRFNWSFQSEQERNSVCCLIFCFVFLDLIANDQTTYFQFQRQT